jgi:periplasmic divalent cation tolerance protein
MQNKFIIVYVTHKNQEEADKIVKILLDKKIIACANFFPISACYFWNNEIANENEIVSLLKTRIENFAILEKIILENHPYKIPCIIKFEVEANQAYYNWILEETKNSKI